MRQIGGFWNTTVGIRIWIIMVAATWATAFPFFKQIREAGFGPFGAAAGRSLTSAALFAILLILMSHKIAKDKAILRHILLLGLFNGMVPNILIAFAMSDLATAPAALIQASVPILVALSAHFLFRYERLSALQYFGVLLGFVGVFVVFGPADILAGQKPWAGSLAMLLAAVSYTASTLYLRAKKPDDTLSITLGSQIVSGLCAAVLFGFLERDQAIRIVPSVILNFVGIALMSTLVPTILYFRLVKTVEAARASLVQYLLPVFTAFYGFWLLHEPFEWNVLWGGVAVMGGMILTTRVPAKKDG
jgi:drug/metabolite transporter (DMT)-like permease